ncbi:MAG: hypothetical protein NT099_01165 [Candidatus Saganbacteria bacterium]|nr:hypothetical protein [Candidatus Saganbacteria bacterium]
MNGMTPIVKTITKFVGSIILLFGLYLIVHGHLSPGGGFEGGVTVAAALILITLAYGKDAVFETVDLVGAFLLQSTGMLIFLAFALLGFTGGYFLLNFLPKGKAFTFLSGGTIIPFTVGIGVTAAFALFGIFIVLVSFRIFKDTEKK